MRARVVQCDRQRFDGWISKHTHSAMPWRHSRPCSSGTSVAPTSLVIRRCRRRESNPHCSGPKPDLSACWSTPAPVARTPRLRERMAVRTHDTEILEPVVTWIAVDVIEGEGQRPTLPGVDAAELASGLLEPGGDQPDPQ